MSSAKHVLEPPPVPLNIPVADLLLWYGFRRRPLPWRETKDPYRIWLSEIMLQQTQVATVIPYYQHFLHRFPTLSDLARAHEQDVLKAWENLGYYSRARQLHRTAKIIMARHNGCFPDRWEDLVALPGIGNYTGAAILSIAFNQSVPAIDGNVRRVLCRFYALRDVFPDKSGDRQLGDILTPFVPSGQSGDFNQAMMELGATVCRPRKPLCGICPLGERCLAFAAQNPESYPVRRLKKNIPLRYAVAAVILDDGGHILMARRAQRGLLGGLWKFPGGFCKTGEDPHEALERTVQEEVGFVLREKSLQGVVRHAYTHFRLRLLVFTCSTAHAPQNLGTALDCQWISPSGIHKLPLSKADRLAAVVGGVL